nr:hypothetical protein [Tanacetum cinerariifolium]
MEPSRSLFDNDQAESSSLSNDKSVSEIKLAVVKEGIPGRSASMAGEGSKRRRSITESLEEESYHGEDVEEAHAAHNMISGLYCPFLELFDGVPESFYKLEFPYISLLLGKAGQSLEELFVGKAPSIQETQST